MKRIYVLLPLGILFTVLIVFIWFKATWIPYYDECNELYELTKMVTYKGKVIEKFDNLKNHGARSIKLNTNHDTIIVGMPNDISELYDI